MSLLRNGNGNGQPNGANEAAGLSRASETPPTSFAQLGALNSALHGISHGDGTAQEQQMQAQMQGGMGGQSGGMGGQSGGIGGQSGGAGPGMHGVPSAWLRAGRTLVQEGVAADGRAGSLQESVLGAIYSLRDLLTRDVLNVRLVPFDEF